MHCNHVMLRHFLLRLSLLVFASACIIVPLSLNQDEKNRELIISKELTHLRLDVAVTKRFFAEREGDIAIISQLPEIKKFMQQPREDERRSIERQFQNFCEAYKQYEQIRLLDTAGNERIRVNQVDNACELVPESQLQNKSERYYFQETLQLHQQESFVSPLDLNVEKGVIEQPSKPVLRISTPVYSDIGELIAVVVVNYLGKRIIHEFNVSDGSYLNTYHHHNYLINAQGYYLVSDDDPTMEFGFMYGREEDAFSVQQPLVWQAIKNGETRFSTDEGIYLAEIIEVPMGRVRDIDNKEVTQWYRVSFIPKTTLNKQSILFGPNNLVWISAYLLLISLLSYLWTIIKCKNDKLITAANFNNALFENAPDGVVVVDADGVIIQANEHMQVAFGYQRNELVGQKVELLVPDAKRGGHVYRRQSYLENPIKREMSPGNYLMVRRKDGSEFPALIGLNSFVQEKQQLVICSIYDITARVDAERKMVEANQKIQKANEIKSAFLANMSHELRTPMHGIMSFAKFGVDKFDKVEKEKLLEYFQYIIKSGERLLHLINDVLDLSKLEVGRMQLELELTDLNKLISDCIAEQQQRLEDSKISVEVKSEKTDIRVNADTKRIFQVVTNLLSNAIKFSLQQSKVVISLENRSNTVTFSITDSGVGIPEQDLESIFEPFSQSRNQDDVKQAGTGLGLSICKEIIELHNGKIWAENNKDGGAIITFTLPTNLVETDLVKNDDLLSGL